MKIVNGNLIDLSEDGHFDVIIQGCNCQNTMGSGIAKEIRSRYPQAYEVDLRTKKGDRDKLGTFSLAYVNKVYPFIIVNAYAQFDYNRNGSKIDHFEYDAFERILNTLSKNHGHYRYGLPMLGMGLAGGDPERIMGLIEKFDRDIEKSGGTVTLVKFVV